MKEPHIFDVIADLVAESYVKEIAKRDNAIAHRIAEVYQEHNQSCVCPCDYCQGMRATAERYDKEALAASDLKPGDINNHALGVCDLPWNEG